MSLSMMPGFTPPSATSRAAAAATTSAAAIAKLPGAGTMASLNASLDDLHVDQAMPAMPPGVGDDMFTCAPLGA
jgi:hypothetical protein